MALSTSTTARWRSLSSSAATPNGRCRPSAFGMYTLRDGLARYRPCEPGMKIPKVRFEILPVIRPRHAVHPRCGLRLQRPVGRPQAINIDMMQERGESCILVLPCDSAHAIQRTWRVLSGSESGTRFAVHVLLAQAAFLPRLRRRQASIVRRFRRYYGPVRLPTPVHLRRTASAFPERPAPPSRRRVAMGPPGSRAWRLHACTGSSTAQGPLATRETAAGDVAFRLVQRRQHPKPLISRLDIPACVYPYRRFAAALADGRRMARGHRESLTSSM